MYKYDSMLMHLFDRFYVVTKFILPSTGDLKFSNLYYDNTCTHVDNKDAQSTEMRKYMLDLRTFCKKIEPFVNYYKRFIKLYSQTVHYILENDINLILDSSSTETEMWHCHHSSAIPIIGLNYEGTSSILITGSNRALHKPPML